MRFIKGSRRPTHKREDNLKLQPAFSTAFYQSFSLDKYFNFHEASGLPSTMSTTAGMRLYLAYWRRQAKYNTKATVTPSYHVGLLLCPRNPSNKDATAATVYHATNKAKAGSAGAEFWIFEAGKSFPRSQNLVGCMLLGVVSSDIDEMAIKRILSGVNIPGLKEAETRGWRCSHWLLDALAVRL